MSKPKDDIVRRMFDYLEHAKKVLSEDGFLQPTVFAKTRMHDSMLVLPIVNEDNDLPDVALDLISKVLHAYNVTEYYVVSESYHLRGTDSQEMQECINIIYVGNGERKLISLAFRRLAAGEMFFGETVEIQATNIEGSVLDLFRLKERSPRLPEREKAQIRMMFPAQTDEEIAASNYFVH